MFVIAIILVMFVLYWGGGLGGKKSRQKEFGPCAKNLQFIHTALLTYAADNNDKFPVVPRAQTSEEPLSLLIPKYNSQTAPFICPASGDKELPEGESFAKRRISYAYVMGLARTAEPTQFLLSDEQIDTTRKIAGAPVFAISDAPPGNNHGSFGGNLLMVDGSVQMISVKAPALLDFTNATLLNPKPKPKK